MLADENKSRLDADNKQGEKNTFGAAVKLLEDKYSQLESNSRSDHVAALIGANICVAQFLLDIDVVIQFDNQDKNYGLLENFMRHGSEYLQQISRGEENKSTQQLQKAAQEILNNNDNSLLCQCFLGVRTVLEKLVLMQPKHGSFFQQGSNESSQNFTEQAMERFINSLKL